MNRRDLIKRGSMATALVAVGGLQLACKPQNLSGWVSTIVSAFGEMKPLLTQMGLSELVITRVSGWIDTAVKVAKDFDAAYRAGKFSDAVTLFTNLGKLITDIAADLNVTDNRIVKLALVTIAIARIAIASLLKSQSDNQPAVGLARQAASADDEKKLAEIERLAAINIDGLVFGLYKHP